MASIVRACVGHRAEVSSRGRHHSQGPRRVAFNDTYVVGDATPRTHAEQIGERMGPVERFKTVFLASIVSMSMLLPLAVHLPPAEALSDPVVVDTNSALSLEDQRVADIYRKANRSVATIFDSTAAGKLSGTGTQQEGNGSGIVYDKTGSIVTNYHVLAKAVESIGVPKAVQSKAPIARVVVIVDAATDRQQAFPAYVVGADKSRDLLVLRAITPDDSVKFYPARFGDSSDMRVGSTILSLGAPFGFEHSMSKGIISARNRGFQSYTDSTISGAFQIDAATNPGNSGGPVVNLDGEVVAVNTAIFTNTGVSARIGFAIPSNTVSKVVDEIIEFGEVRRASLGIKPAADNVKNSLNVQEGVLIQAVEKGGPSDGKLSGISRGVGGIVPGDVIVRIDDKEVKNIFDLSRHLEEKRIGEEVDVSVIHDGSLIVVRIELAKE